MSACVQPSTSTELALANFRSLFCGLNPRVKRLAVYVAYSDESAFNGRHGEHFFTSGYVAREGDWPYFVAAWQERVLDGPPKIPFLHMTEMRSKGWRVQHGITEHEADRRVSEACRVVGSMGSIYALSSIMPMDIFRRICQPDGRNRVKHFSFKYPDYLCFMIFAMQAVKCLSGLLPDVEQINFYVEAKDSIPCKNLRGITEAIKANLSMQDPAMGSLVGEVGAVGKTVQLPLQAADLLCWHLRRGSEYEAPTDLIDLRRLAQISSKRGSSETVEEGFLRRLYESSVPG